MGMGRREEHAQQQLSGPREREGGGGWAKKNTRHEGDERHTKGTEDQNDTSVGQINRGVCVVMEPSEQTQDTFMRAERERKAGQGKQGTGGGGGDTQPSSSLLLSAGPDTAAATDRRRKKYTGNR